MSECALVAVQVVNYRTRRYLERCVATAVSDLDRSSMSFEINLLDNASGEDLDDAQYLLILNRHRGCRANWQR